MCLSLCYVQISDRHFGCKMIKQNVSGGVNFSDVYLVTISLHTDFAGHLYVINAYVIICICIVCLK